MMNWFLRIIFIGLFTVSTAFAGSLDAPAPPDSSGSAMHTLEHIYQILMTGDPDQITMRHAFEEPKYGPDVPSGFPDLDEIYNATPKYHENAATVDDVVPGKFFWGLGKKSDGEWGLLYGSPDSTRIESPVLKTGQTTQASNYNDWNSANYQDDAYWEAQGFGIDVSNANGARFEVNKKPDDQKDNGTVTDKKTGLMWTQNANFFDASMTWYDAFTNVKNLNSLPIGCSSSGEVSCYTDWRLPNIKELQSLIDYGHTAPAMPENHEDAFTQSSVKNYYYWSSTTNLNNPYASAWAVYMVTGLVTGQSKSNPCYVWPVRGGKK